eukprot:augustus_masked-scaffold_2-processed-gene-14.49-mRNA-1 protein AED:0.37 eAED:0.39 QI:0/-1/0/1/-1/1/1/0/890
MTPEAFRTWLRNRKRLYQVPEQHSGSPIFFKLGSSDLSGENYIGGFDDLVLYIRKHFPSAEFSDLLALKNQEMERETQKHVFEESESDYLKEEMREEDIVESKSLLITPQVNFNLRKKRVVTAYRKNKDKAMTNYKVLWQYLMSEKGYKFIGNAPAMGSYIFVQDQASAVQALKYKNAIVNNIGWGGQSCFGGTKGAQIRCRYELAEKHGCSFNELYITPPSYRLWVQDECEHFFHVCPADQDKLWIEKPSGGQHGVGMKVHKGCEALSQKYTCSQMQTKKFFVMPYISPALLSGHKFDLRSYLLVASLNPLVAYYHHAFARKAFSPYSSDSMSTNAHITNALSQPKSPDFDHFWDFVKLEDHLHRFNGFPEDYMNNQFKSRAKQVQRFVLEASREKMARNKGAFQLFALDWVIDDQGGVHLLECNSNPLVTEYPIPGFGTKDGTWGAMMDLIEIIHVKGEVPTEYKGWESIYTEMENGKEEYNSCNIFAKPFNPGFDIAKNIEEHTEEISNTPDEDNELDQEKVDDVSNFFEPEKESETQDYLIPPEPNSGEFPEKSLRLAEVYKEYKCKPLILKNAVLDKCVLFQNTKHETYFYVKGSTKPGPIVLLISGVHGNEPSGMVATEYVKHHVDPVDATLVIIPQISRHSDAGSQRYIVVNGQRIDINRQFSLSSTLSGAQTPLVIQKIWELMTMLKPDIVTDFHEGWGIYHDLSHETPTEGHLVGNKKFSKGSSIIASSGDALSAASDAVNRINEDIVANPNGIRFEVIEGPIEGGLVRKLVEEFGIKGFVQETTSRTLDQPIYQRAKQHVIMWKNCVQFLGVTAELQDPNFSLMGNCVPGRKSCKNMFPNDKSEESEKSIVSESEAVRIEEKEEKQDEFGSGLDLFLEGS